MIDIVIVDAFTEEPFFGNPAAICIVNDFPDKTLMQNIATEMNLSETAFVKPISDHRYFIRWFTPNSEAPLCGHATIAATQILLERGLVNRNIDITFNTINGEFCVYISNDNWINLSFPVYPVIATPPHNDWLNIVGAVPIFTGISQNCIFMEFSDQQQILNLKPDLRSLMHLDYRALIVTAQGIEYDFVSRYFAPKVGINEDPVCASAHCRLIPYWSNKIKKEEMFAYQLSQRGGVIKCRNLQNKVLISGKAVTVLRGKVALEEKHDTQQLLMG